MNGDGCPEKSHSKYSSQKFEKTVQKEKQILWVLGIYVHGNLYEFIEKPIN